MNASRQVITIPLQDEDQLYTPKFALFEMVNGRSIMTPCDAEGNLYVSDCETQLDPDSHKVQAS